MGRCNRHLWQHLDPARHGEHRTKAGEWYAVNLSERMPRITESQHNRAKARGHRRWKKFQKIIDDNPNPEATRG
jgi:hypothetical protein